MEDIIETPTYEWGDMHLKFTDEAEATAVLYETVQTTVRKPIASTQYLVQGEPDADGDVENYATEDPPEGAVILDSWPIESSIEEAGTMQISRYPHSIDTIGIIYERTGGTDEEPVMTALPGWHVNVRGPKMPELQAYAVEVNSPVRVWA